MDEINLTVTEFIALFNQSLEYAYPSVVITGELANFRVSKNRWIYFDLKDDQSTLKFFGTVYQLPGPLENGLLLKVKGQPRLHNLYGFSVNIISLQPAGEGSLKKVASLLQAKLASEGLFDDSRKRSLPYPPTRIGLITSKESAAYGDFIKIINSRWRGLRIDLIDVLVQGEMSPPQLVAAIEQFNEIAAPPEVIVIIRGGGSAEDLAAYNTELVTRAVAASRVPTLVAIGHEVDLSLAELAADKRASTPSNAAEMLVPERNINLAELLRLKDYLNQNLRQHVHLARADLSHKEITISNMMKKLVTDTRSSLIAINNLIEAYNPEAVLKRGYSIVRSSSLIVLRNTKSLNTGDIVKIQLYKGNFDATVNKSK